MKQIGKYSIALFIDAPNMMRSEYKFRLDDIERVAGEYGDILLRKIYFTHDIRDERPKLTEAAFMHGFETLMCVSDIDTKLVADAVRIITTRDDIDLIALASSDSDYIPVIHEANNYGKDTLIMFGNKCPSLQKSSRYSMDMVEYMKTKGEGPGPQSQEK